MSFRKTLICLWLGTLLCGPFAFAQKKSRFRSGPEVRSSAPTRSTKDHNIIKEDGKNVMYKKRNVVDFDDSLIEGEVRNPGEFYFTVRPTTPSKNLLEKRKNFHDSMLRDTVNIR